MDAGILRGSSTIRFQLTRWDLFQIVRITASRRPLRKVAMPALAGFMFLGYAVDGNYIKGSLWAISVAGLYWGISNLMFLLHVYAGSNLTLLVPQEITLHDDKMIVESEHSREEFDRPRSKDLKISDKFLEISWENGGNLIFTRKSFKESSDFEQLKSWLVG